MEYKIIDVESYVGTVLKLELSIQTSDTLVVLLPGSAYTIYGPSLFYAYSVVSELGYDVLTIEYGYQKMNGTLDFDNYVDILNECKIAINKAVSVGNYNNLVFIGKSLGTNIMSDVLVELSSEFNTIPIFITPNHKAIKTIKAFDSLVIVGTNDPLFKHIDIKDIANLENVELYLIEGADHFLEVGSFIDSIEYMKQSNIRIKNYILSRIKS